MQSHLFEQVGAPYQVLQVEYAQLCGQPPDFLSNPLENPDQPLNRSFKLQLSKVLETFFVRFAACFDLGGDPHMAGAQVACPADRAADRHHGGV